MSPVEIQAQIEIFVTAFRTLPREAQRGVLTQLQIAASAPAAVPQHNAQALQLLRTWLADDTGYDEQTWPALKQTMEAQRLSDRRLFDDHAPTLDA